MRRSNRKLVVSKHFHESEKIRDILNLSSSWLFCWKNAHLKFDIGNSGYTIASYHMYKLSINCLISFNSLYLFWSTRKLHMLKKQLRSILWICSIWINKSHILIKFSVINLEYCKPVLMKTCISISVTLGLIVWMLTFWRLLFKPT